MGAVDIDVKGSNENSGAARLVQSVIVWWSQP